MINRNHFAALALEELVIEHLLHLAASEFENYGKSIPSCFLPSLPSCHLVLFSLKEDKRRTVAWEESVPSEYGYAL